MFKPIISELPYLKYAIKDPMADKLYLPLLREFKDQDIDLNDYLQSLPQAEQPQDSEEFETPVYTDPTPGFESFRDAYIKAVGQEDELFPLLSKIARYESGYNPSAKNPHAPAYGYFQFMQDGERYNNITAYGKTDISTFLSDPVLQINAARSLAESFYNSLDSRDFSRMRDLGITKEGAIAGMWLGGLGKFREYIHEGKNADDKSWSPTGSGIDMRTQIARYNKKGGKIEKASLGTIFSNDEPRRRSAGVGFDVSAMYYKPDRDIYSSYSYTPTVDDIVDFIVSYEDFRSKPYIVKGQELIGHGLSDKALINKYRDTGIPEEVSLQEVKNLVNNILTSHELNLEGFKDLPMNVKLAITDIIYNGKGDNELLSSYPKSPNLKAAIKDGDLERIISEMDHSKTAGGWLGVRSAARRAMASGNYYWRYPHKDRLGRHIDPTKSNVLDYKNSPYINY